MHASIWCGSLRKGDHLKDLGLDGQIILKWIFRKWYGDMGWIDLIQCMDSNKLSDSIKC
jgi:hypothetical protein